MVGNMAFLLIHLTWETSYLALFKCCPDQKAYLYLVKLLKYIFIPFAIIPLMVNSRPRLKSP